MQLTFEDDVTTVQQFRQLFTVIPELMHIKMLEFRGAYGAPAPLQGAIRSPSLTKAPSVGTARNR